jgi:hypothetical protein
LFRSRIWQTTHRGLSTAHTRGDGIDLPDGTHKILDCVSHLLIAEVLENRPAERR